MGVFLRICVFRIETITKQSPLDKHCQLSKSNYSPAIAKKVNTDEHQKENIWRSNLLTLVFINFSLVVKSHSHHKIERTEGAQA